MLILHALINEKKYQVNRKFIFIWWGNSLALCEMRKWIYCGIEQLEDDFGSRLAFFRALALTDAAAAQGEKKHSEKMSMKNQKWIQMKEKNLFTALRSLELYFSLEINRHWLEHRTRGEFESERISSHTSDRRRQRKWAEDYIFASWDDFQLLFSCSHFSLPYQFWVGRSLHSIFSQLFLQLLGSTHRKKFCCNEVNWNATRENKHTHRARTSAANEKMN